MEISRKTHRNSEDNKNIELREKLGFDLGKNVRNWVQEFIKQLAEGLEKMEEILVVDRIEGNVAVCENRNNKKMQNINLADLPDNIKEGSILKWKNGKYEIDTSSKIEQRIEQKMQNVWKD